MKTQTRKPQPKKPAPKGYAYTVTILWPTEPHHTPRTFLNVEEKWPREALLEVLARDGSQVIQPQGHCVWDLLHLHMGDFGQSATYQDPRTGAMAIVTRTK